MEVMVLMDYLNIIVCGICLCVGYVIKNVIPNKEINKYIPLIMLVLGTVLSFWIHFAVTPEYVLEGMFSGLASTGLYEMFRNLINKEE